MMWIWIVMWTLVVLARTDLYRIWIWLKLVMGCHVFLAYVAAQKFVWWCKVALKPLVGRLRIGRHIGLRRRKLRKRDFTPRVEFASS